MEKTFYSSPKVFTYSPKGRPLNFLTLTVTEERMFINDKHGKTVWDIKLTDIIFVRIRPYFMAAHVEVCLSHDKVHTFEITGINRFFQTLRELNVPVDGNKSSTEILFRIYYWVLAVFTLAVSMYFIMTSLIDYVARQ